MQTIDLLTAVCHLHIGVETERTGDYVINIDKQN